jgi:DnaJ family protein A protein 2
LCEGEIIKPKDRCKTCNGEKVVCEKTELGIYVEKGMHDGQKITLKEAGDQLPDIIPGEFNSIILLY